MTGRLWIITEKTPQLTCCVNSVCVCVCCVCVCMLCVYVLCVFLCTVFVRVHSVCVSSWCVSERMVLVLCYESVLTVLFLFPFKRVLSL